MTVAAATLAFAAALTPPQPSIPESFDRYLAGQYAAVVQQLTAGGDESEAFRRFRLEASRWIATDPAATSLRRRAAVALALEVAALEMLHAWAPCRELLDWGAAELRQEPSSRFEAAWVRAAAALGFRAQDMRWLVDQGFLTRAKSRHPDDPHIRFLSVAARLTVPGSGWLAVPDDDAQAMAAMTGDAVVGVDADLRLAQLYLQLQTYDRALHHAWRVTSRASDPPAVYLGRFLAGRALEGKGDTKAAAAEYEQALGALPGAQSATLALAALEANGGDGSRGLRRAERALVEAGPAEHMDPWRLMPYGEFRRFPELISQLREGLK